MSADPATSVAASDAPTLRQSVVVELAFGVVGLVLIVVTGRSLWDAFRVVAAPPVAAAGPEPYIDRKTGHLPGRLG